MVQIVFPFVTPGLPGPLAGRAPSDSFPGIFFHDPVSGLRSGPVCSSQVKFEQNIVSTPFSQDSTSCPNLFMPATPLFDSTAGSGSPVSFHLFRAQLALIRSLRVAGFCSATVTT